MQAQERRNAENLSESVGISALAMQRFPTEARWSGDTVIGRLQKYLAPRLGHPEAVWVFHGSDFPKQGRKSAGVARQAGEGGQLPGWYVPGLCQPSAPGAVRARGVAAMAEGVSTTQRAGVPLPRKTPLRSPSGHAGATTLKPLL